MFKRRTIIGGAAGVLAGTMLSPKAHALVKEFQPIPSGDDDRMKVLISTAVDSAKSAGADYADARLTFSQEMLLLANKILHGEHQRPHNRREEMVFGVRANCNGYWGFSSSTIWTKEEAARLGRAAVDSAKANFSAKERPFYFAPNSNATSGSWVMPIKDDPFAMDPVEMSDYLTGISEYIEFLGNEYFDLKGEILDLKLLTSYQRQQKSFGNTEGQFVTQRLYRSGGDIGFTLDRSEILRSFGIFANGVVKQFNMAGAGVGFELFRNPDIREQIKELYEELAEEALLPWIPVDVGKFDCLLHPDAVAPMVKKSIGVATEVDRVMGFEANNTGTSYITDPDTELGSLKIGNSAVNVTATRSLPGGLMTAKWDDEGVSPIDVQIVKNGILNNLQTGREGAGWVRAYLEQNGNPVASSGCSHGIDAADSQTVYPSDLIFHPDPKVDTTTTQLREQIDNGLEFKVGGVLMDFQQSTGMFVSSSAFQVKKGKRVARIISPGMLFRTAELWGNVKGLGGQSTTMRIGTSDYKSSPAKKSYSSVDAPSVLFKDMSIINPAQKA